MHMEMEVLIYQLHYLLKITYMKELNISNLRYFPWKAPWHKLLCKQGKLQSIESYMNIVKTWQTRIKFT